MFSQKLFEFLRIQHHLFCLRVNPCAVEEVVAVSVIRKAITFFPGGMKRAEIGDRIDMNIF